MPNTEVKNERGSWGTLANLAAQPMIKTHKYDGENRENHYGSTLGSRGVNL